MLESLSALASRFTRKDRHAVGAGTLNTTTRSPETQTLGTSLFLLLSLAFRLIDTDLIDESITELAADVIWLLPWDDVPEAYNRWVTIRAARIFSDRSLGSEALFKYTKEDEKDAQAELERIEMEQEQSNMLTGANAFPTYQPATGLMNRRVANGYSII